MFIACSIVTLSFKHNRKKDKKGKTKVVIAAIIGVILVQLGAGVMASAAPIINSRPAGNGNFTYRMFGGSDNPTRVSNSVAQNYDVFLLSPSHVSIATKIKSLNSDAVIYMYKDASSTRFDANDPQSS